METASYIVMAKCWGNLPEKKGVVASRILSADGRNMAVVPTG